MFIVVSGHNNEVAVVRGRLSGEITLYTCFILENFTPILNFPNACK